MLLWILNYKGTSLVISPAIINNGKVEYEKFHTAGKKVNRNTVFQVASLSKWISAFGIMKLVEDGRLDLDKPVSNYLSRWKLPEGEFNNEVTVRRLLSHTAGLTDGLGYSGFETVGEMQSLEQSLTMAADADSGITGKVQVGVIPGSEFKYSGGGYTLLQLIVEEVTNQSFALYMQEAVFKPLGMFHSTFIWNDSNAVELCEFYDDAYFPSKHRYYTSQAASGLYTSLADMELFFQAHFMGRNGEPAGRNVIKPATLKLMRAPHGNVMGVDIWGLGTVLYAATNTDDFIIGHDGKSTPAINTAIRLNPITGDGIIILETGNSEIATHLASEWVYWKTGEVDTFLFPSLINGMIFKIGIGWIVILISVIIYQVRRKFRKKRLIEH